MKLRVNGAPVVVRNEWAARPPVVVTHHECATRPPVLVKRREWATRPDGSRSFRAGRGKAQAETLVHDARAVCPYSNVARGNVM